MFCFFKYITLDDKKLGGVLKKMGLQPLNNFEEVNIFKSDGEVLHITTPKSMSACYLEVILDKKF